jgi:ribonuclease HI
VFSAETIGPNSCRVMSREQMSMINLNIIAPAAEAEATARRWQALGAECFWTDGSRLDGHTGAAAVRLSDGSFQAQEFYMGTRTEVFDAELYAIYGALRGARRLLDTGHAFRKVAVFSDAQAALMRLRTDNEGPGQCIGRWISREAQELRRQEVSVEFRWLPSHIGIPGNEAADAAAKHATTHRCDNSHRCARRECHDVPWTSLAHVNRQATEAQSRLTKEWIRKQLAASRSYKTKAKWGIREALKTIPKRRAAVFLQLASGHALIGTHLSRIKKKEVDTCWWCRSGRKQTRGHLFGGCKAWKRELLALRKKIEKITGKKRGRGDRLKVVTLFQDERLTDAILEFLAETEIGRRYE